jgi:hypothetical protein
MARATPFSTAFAGGVALLTVLAAGLGLLLTGERATRLPAPVEVGWLAVVAALLLTAVVGGRAAGGGWAVVAAGGALALLVVLGLLSLMDGGSASAALLELAGAVLVVLFLTQLRPSAG